MTQWIWKNRRFILEKRIDRKKAKMRVKEAVKALWGGKKKYKKKRISDYFPASQ